MAKLTLYGGCVFGNVSVEECYGDVTDGRLQKIKHNPLENQLWDENTVLSANFANDSLSGSNFDGSFSNGKYASIDRYRIYKAHSKQPQLYTVFETSSPNETIIEDFTVGSKCDYTYYVVPVCKDKNQIESLGSIMQSKPIQLDDGVIRVIGLIQDPSDLETYYVDMNNVWNFSLNVNNTGFQNNMGKTYNDTPQKYPVEIKNKGFYRSFNINGLLGKYDCDKMDYIDTYDDIIEWENFVDNGEMKLVIDLRGIMTIGTMESSSIEYDEFGAHCVSANFSIKQLEDINNITILNRQLLFNPTKGEELLYEANGLALQDNTNAYLIAKGGEQ